MGIQHLPDGQTELLVELLSVNQEISAELADPRLRATLTALWFPGYRLYPRRVSGSQRHSGSPL